MTGKLSTIFRAEDQIYPLDFSHFLLGNLSITAENHHFAMGIFSFVASNNLPALPIALVGDGTGVNEHHIRILFRVEDIAFAFEHFLHGFGFVLIHFAAQRINFKASQSLPLSIKRRTT